MNFDREILLKAIEEIDKNPELSKNRSSSTYDLVFNNQKYPPILVLSVASTLSGEKEILLSDYSSTEKPFKILRDNGFQIIKKDISYYDELINFLNQSQTDNLKYSRYKKSFFDLEVKVSFGQGGAATIPWISFLRDGMTTSKGIYPVYLYFKKENLLILAYGISETKISSFTWPDVHSLETISGYFERNNLGKPFRYGNCFIHKIYETENLPERDLIDEDLIDLLSIYKSLDLGKNIFLKIQEMAGFNCESFLSASQAAKLKFSSSLILRFIASLTTKPFVILTGLSGSGKTKIAQSFVKWICDDESQYKIIPVGADWTNREPLLGYPNGLNPNEYIAPDSGVLNLILEASKPENADKPYFMILDEMNLSHVERYFADFLSVMESDDKINLYSGTIRKDSDENEIPTEIFWSKNLFIIGTVNIDETTYMFSPKVLDRANTIEFRVDEADIKSFFEMPRKIDLSILESKGASMAKDFLEIAANNTIEKDDEYTDVLLKFFNELKKVGAEFGYRTAVEMLLLIEKLNVIGNVSKNESIDIAIMQKLLPKLHGSRSKISKVLDALILLCLKDGQTFSITKSEEVLPENINYPISFEKLVRMYKNALDNGFTSYAEA